MNNNQSTCEILDCPQNGDGKCRIDGMTFGTVERDGTGIVTLGPKRCFHRKFKLEHR